MNAPAHTHAHFTDCGLPGVREVPYGVHMCHFYRTDEDLAGVLVPYFAAGLRSNERCIWITAEPVNEEVARRALRKTGIDVDAEERKGALVVRSHADWYSSAGELKGNAVAELWFKEEERALATGYAGLRITGNVTFVTPQTWPVFMQYEALLNHALEGRRILALCTYQLGQCGAAEVLDVVHRHHCALDHPDGGWQVLMRPPPSSLAAAPA